MRGRYDRGRRREEPAGTPVIYSRPARIRGDRTNLTRLAGANYYSVNCYIFASGTDTRPDRTDLMRLNASCSGSPARERAQRRDGHAAGGEEPDRAAGRRRGAGRGVVDQEIEPEAHQAADVRRRPERACRCPCWSPDASGVSSAVSVGKTPQPTVARGVQSVSAAAESSGSHREGSRRSTARGGARRTARSAATREIMLLRPRRRRRTARDGQTQ